VNRREFITLLGGAAPAWPLTARGQQGKRMRRIGVLMSAVEGDQRGLETAFAQGLAELGWTVGRNVRIEYRWGAGDQSRSGCGDGRSPIGVIARGHFNVPSDLRCARKNFSHL
jgi:putative ABC transport system substrate-binding protein